MSVDKEALLRKELNGLAVMWNSREDNGVIDMAKVNGHSIIWHKYAYTTPDEPTVEVYFRDADDVEGHVPVKGLRERIEG